MADIGQREWEFCYQAAVRVLENSTRLADEVRSVVTNTEMNAGSARDYIDGYIHLYQGKLYTRTMSFNGTSYFLNKIRERYGTESERLACHTVLQHIEYYKNLEKGGFQRKIFNEVNSRLAALGRKGEAQQTLSQHMINLDLAVEKALQAGKKSRRERLLAATKKPTERTMVTKVFARNPDVIAEVLERASGSCEHCNTKAPFTRKNNNTLYLEIHHRIPLAEGGNDTVENAIALCPNCHREAHYGINWEKFRK